jgi:F0F1-type ATP synthase assembly protein I
MAEEREPSDEELAERLRKLLGEKPESDKDSEPEVDPLEAKLAEIEDQTKQIRERHAMPDVPDWDYKRPKSTMGKETELDYRGIGLGFSVLYALCGPLFVGFGIGWFIDSRVGGSNGRLWGTLIGAIAGLVGAVVMMNAGNRTGPKQ